MHAMQLILCNVSKHTLNPKRHTLSMSSWSHRLPDCCSPVFGIFQKQQSCVGGTLHYPGPLNELLQFCNVWTGKEAKEKTYMPRKAEVQFSGSCWSLPKPEITILWGEITTQNTDESNYHIILAGNSKLRTGSSRVRCDARKRLRMVIHLIPAMFSKN